MQTPDVLVTGIVFGEQPRWHEGRLWFSDWGTQEVIAVDPDGATEVMHRGSSFPLCVDWLPDGRLLVVDTSTGRLLVQVDDGSLEMYADLRQASDPPAINELVVDGRGNAYVNGGGFDMMAGELYAPGGVVLVTAAGTARQVADGLAFPNGMAVTGDNQTLIVGESYAKRLTAYEITDDGNLTNRRAWAELGDGVPDGSASTPKEPSGTPTCRTSAASAYAKAATSSTQSSLTAAVSPARSAAPTNRPSTSSPPNGTAPKTCSKATEPDSYSPSPRPRLRQVGQEDDKATA